MLNPVQLTQAAKRLCEQRGIPRAQITVAQLNAAQYEIFSFLQIQEAVDYVTGIEPTYGESQSITSVGDTPEA